MTFPMVMRSILGPFTFTLSFLAIEMFKLSYSVLAGFSSFSAVLQLTFMADVRLVPSVFSLDHKVLPRTPIPPGGGTRTFAQNC